jgi:hypothetical protein
MINHSSSRVVQFLLFCVAGEIEGLGRKNQFNSDPFRLHSLPFTIITECVHILVRWCMVIQDPGYIVHRCGDNNISQTKLVMTRTNGKDKKHNDSFKGCVNDEHAAHRQDPPGSRVSGPLVVLANLVGMIIII